MVFSYKESLSDLLHLVLGGGYIDLCCCCYAASAAGGGGGGGAAAAAAGVQGSEKVKLSGKIFLKIKTLHESA